MGRQDSPPPSSRRDFLLGAAGVAVGAGILGAKDQANALGTGRRGRQPSRHPTAQRIKVHPSYQRGRFESATGGTLRLTLDTGPVTLRIAEVEPLDVAAEARSGSNLWQNAFRVLLTGPKGLDIPQGTYPVTVGGRSFDLFVVPILRTTETPRFEAIIHRAYHRRARG
jgi:hypothetical protein